MKIPKRKQILTYSIPGRVIGAIEVEYLVLVREVSHTKKGCKVIGLARHFVDRDPKQWFRGVRKPDEVWGIKPKTVHAKLVSISDLPLYLHWECGEAFSKLLKEL